MRGSGMAKCHIFSRSSVGSRGKNLKVGLRTYLRFSLMGLGGLRGAWDGCWVVWRWRRLRRVPALGVDFVFTITTGLGY